MRAATDEGRANLVARGYAASVVTLRWLIVAAWIAAAVLAYMRLPDIGTASEASASSLLPAHSRAVQTDKRSAALFGYPLLSQTTLVQRSGGTLPPGAYERAARAALAVRGGRDAALRPLLFAAPVPNAPVPFAREHGTGIVTYLFYRPDTSLTDQIGLTDRYADRYLGRPDDHVVGQTGALAARAAQEQAILDAIPRIEIATVIVIFLVLSLALRSLLAPLVPIAVTGLAYVIASRLVGWAGGQVGIEPPRELEPLILVLLFGIVTDYAIFYLTDLRGRLHDGEERLAAARGNAALIGPIVLVAGLIVAAGTASTVVSTTSFFRALGPGMAVTAAIGAAISLTLIPALAAIVGPWLFRRASRAGSERAQAGDEPGDEDPKPGLVGRLAGRRRVAIPVAVVVAAALGYAAYQVTEARLGVNLVQGLPSDSPVHRAERAARLAFAGGMTAPTEVLLERRGIGAQTGQLRRLEQLVSREQGVAGVVGPGEVPRIRRFSALVNHSGNAARRLVVLRQDPYSARAIDDVNRLQSRLPDLVSAAGLRGVRVGVGGETALASETVAQTQHDLWRLSLAALAVNFFFLALFLRALVAPLYLLAASVLALGASLGITVLISQSLLGFDELTYYVPFAAAVLLLSLGSDYNVFVVGRIWSVAKRRPVGQAVVTAAPQASRSIAAAGVVMAASFGLLALVPLVAFREFALAMALGVLIDSFVVRSLLTPALVTSFGSVGSWPGRRLRRASPPARTATDPPG
jgi:RND superfamily putative drug exporter